MCNNFDYIHSSGIDLVRSLKLQTIRGKTRPLSVCFNIQMHSWSRTPLSDYWRQHACWYTWVWYKERWEYGFIPRCTKEIYKRSILYKGSSSWNKLPRRSTSLNGFKFNFRLLNGWIHPEFIVLFICMPILYPILMLSFYQFCLQLVRYIHIRNLSQFIMILLFSCRIYIHQCVYMCSLYLCIFLCNRASLKNSVTEWSTLYEISIFDKIGILRGYAIRSGRRPEGSQRPQGGPQVRPGRWLPEGRLPDRIA